jgi:branched-subunit amino acid aminotransferase/4-amino-4-deoxychorismate lyase
MLYSWVNGFFYAVSVPVVTIHDRGLRFGDGIFETIRIGDGRILNWLSHRHRLDQGLDFFNILLDTTSLYDAACHLVRKNTVDHGYLRLTVTRGGEQGNGIGYKAKNDVKPTVIMETISAPMPVFKRIRLGVSSTRLFYRYPCKTLNAIPYVMALMEAEKQDVDNTILLDSHDCVAETATANIFWCVDNTLYTPSVHMPIVPGTMRLNLINSWQGPVVEGVFPLDVLKEADEVFLTSVGGVVVSVEEIPLLKKRYECIKARHLFQQLI